MNARWRPQERLRHKKKFNELFRDGKSFGVGPMRFFYRLYPAVAAFPRLAAGFVVPKKKIKKAAHRNRVKRRMREALRLQKDKFYAILPPNQAVDVALLYRDAAVCNYSVIYAAVAKAIAKLNEIFNSPNSPPVSTPLL